MELLKKRNRSHECFEDSKSNNNKDEHKKNEMPNFLLKLYRILETPEFNKIIEWGDNGRYFIVKNLNEFTEKILPQYYKHSNFSSFVRQLNMYDFHKKRNCNNENIFSHKNFIRGQRNLIKTIRRKNNTMKFSHNTSSIDDNENALMEYCSKELNSSKRVSKTSLEKTLSLLMKYINETNDRQKVLENKVESLGKQNEEFIIQNQHMLQEIKTKSDYTKKLETLLFFILEVILPKNPFNKTTDKGNAISSGSPDMALQNFSTSNFIQKGNNELTSKILKLDNYADGSILKNFIERFLEHSNKSEMKLPHKVELPMISDKQSNEVVPAKQRHSPLFRVENLSNVEQPQFKLETEEDKYPMFKHSPNPFMEDMVNYSNNCNIFNSPNYPNEFNLYRFNSDNSNIGEHISNNVLNFNKMNENNLPNSRKNSMDINEIFANQNPIDEQNVRKDNIQNIWMDDSIFSVSSPAVSKGSDNNN